jgi:hypothetical protein
MPKIDMNQVNTVYKEDRIQSLQTKIEEGKGLSNQEAKYLFDIYTEEQLNILKQWGAFRHEIRQILTQLGVPSNPCWTEQNILDALKDLFVQDSRLKLLQELKAERDSFRNGQLQLQDILSKTLDDKIGIYKAYKELLDQQVAEGIRRELSEKVVGETNRIVEALNYLQMTSLRDSRGSTEGITHHNLLGVVIDRVLILEKSLKENHQWHLSNDPEEGYQDSAFYERNIKALDTFRSVILNGKSDENSETKTNNA